MVNNGTRNTTVQSRNECSNDYVNDVRLYDMAKSETAKEKLVELSSLLSDIDKSDGHVKTRP